MSTPKQLYAQQRLIYQPELLTCPHCGDLLVTCNYLVWNKTVQTLDRVLSVASRPGRCPNETCAGSRLLRAQGDFCAIAFFEITPAPFQSLRPYGEGNFVEGKAGLSCITESSDNRL